LSKTAGVAGLRRSQKGRRRRRTKSMSDKIPVVDRTTCIGCGLCAEVAPHTFELDSELLSRVINPGGDPEEAVQEAIDGCPVAAISWEE